MAFFMSRYQSLAHNALRVVAGLLFMTHGVQKLFGWFTDRDPIQLLTEFGVAGVLETFGGLAMVLGLFTRPAAFVLSGEMAVAYFWKHAGGIENPWWWSNRGELVALYCFVWLYFSTVGAGKFSIDDWLRRRRERSQ